MDHEEYAVACPFWFVWVSLSCSAPVPASAGQAPCPVPSRRSTLCRFVQSGGVGAPASGQRGLARETDEELDGTVSRVSSRGRGRVFVLGCSVWSLSVSGADLDGCPCLALTLRNTLSFLRSAGSVEVRRTSDPRWVPSCPGGAAPPVLESHEARKTVVTALLGKERDASWVRLLAGRFGTRVVSLSYRLTCPVFRTSPLVVSAGSSDTPRRLPPLPFLVNSTIVPVLLGRFTTFAKNGDADPSGDEFALIVPGAAGGMTTPSPSGRRNVERSRSTTLLGLLLWQ
jgi:hypothetical protein